jgi:aminoglycoside phosphotransferase (APT) family kinase protein
MSAVAVANEENQAVIDWLQSHFGGPVTSFTRQSRWRPVWFATVESKGTALPVCVRGDRTDTALTWDLQHEMRFQKVLEDQGVRVPKVYGWIDRPTAFVQEAVPGRTDFTDLSDEARDSVVDEYLHELARVHALDLAPFVDADIDRAASPDESSLLGMRRMTAVYRRQKAGPDPFMEFCLGWVDRHLPQSHGRETPVLWDSGQFHHTDGRFVSLVDLETGHIGDPMMDLAGWRMRDSVLPFGRFSKLYDRYAEITGKAVDLEAIERHHIYFTLSNHLSFSHTLIDPPATTDYATNLQWCNETNLYATEALAEYLDIELPNVEMPVASTSRATPAFTHLVRTLSTLAIDDEYTRYRLRGAFRMARHLARHDEIGADLLDADLDDVHALLGRRFDSWFDAQSALERYVLEKNTEGALDETLCMFFHKRNLRAQMLNGPAGSAMSRHNPIQSFRD